jgi:hypothetical protein
MYPKSNGFPARRSGFQILDRGVSIILIYRITPISQCDFLPKYFIFLGMPGDKLR